MLEDPGFNKDMQGVLRFNWEGARSVKGTAHCMCVQREAWGSFVKEAGIESE